MNQELMAGIVICLIGLCLLLVQISKLWAITEKWKSKDDGLPSKSYAILMRILGAAFTTLGAALIICGL